MKKFLLFLTLFLSAVGIASAAPASFTIKFAGTTAANDAALNSSEAIIGNISEGKDYVSSFTDFTNVSAGKNSNGLKIANKSSDGKVTINFSESGQVKPTKIVVSAACYNSGEKKPIMSFYVNGSTTATKQQQLTKNDFVDIEVVSAAMTEELTSLKIFSPNYSFVKSITVYYEGEGGSGETPTDPNLTWTLGDKLDDNADVTAYIGEDNTLPTLSFADGAKVSCSSSNTDVATVADDGKVTILAAGTTTITASTPANDATFKQASKSYKLTVTKRFIWSDTKAVLVKDDTALQPGDVIIIANQVAKMAMSTEENENNRRTASVVFTEDLSEITSISNNVLLLELGKSDGCWSFTTLNYLGTAGYLASQNSDKNYLYVTATENDYRWAKIDITNGVAKILFNKGNHNILRYNSSSKLFACYTGGQEPVYIYRLEGSTTITDESADCKTPVENGNTTLTASSKFKTNSTASEFVVKMNGVAINATVKKVGNSVSVDMVGLPYVPGAVFTISPVVDGKELHPVTLGITIPTLPVVDFGAVTLKLYFDKDEYGSKETCALDAWAYLPVVLKDAVSKEVLAPEDARRNLALTFKEFANSVADTEIWGWYDENKDQVQWCKYDYLTSVPVDKTDPENPTADLSSIDLSKTNVELTFTPVYSFNVANKYASLIPSATPGSLSAPARAPEGFTVQNVELTALPVSQTWSDTPDVSGVESVVVEGVDGAVEYYNMQGVRVEGELAPGMYIRRQGRSVSKVQIR